MSKGSVSFAVHRSGGRFHLRVRNPLFSRCVLWVPSDRDERVRPDREFFYHPIWFVLLRHDAFRAQNAGATYQHYMIKCFGDLIGQTVEVYVDDIVVRTREADQLVADLEQMFAQLRANGVRLSPGKCIFGVPRGMLLGFIMSERGIKANPEKTKAVVRMGPIQNLKGVQRITSCLSALNRFISWLGERGLPLYKIMRKSDRFTWTPEAQ